INDIQGLGEITAIIMRLLQEYEQEITVMLIASKRTMQKTLLSVLNSKMFTNCLFSKVFDICEHFLNANKEINVYSISELLSPDEAADVCFLQDSFITNVNYRFYVDKIHEAYFSRLIESARTPQDLEFIRKEQEKYVDTSQLLSISHNSEELLTTEYENQKIITTGYPEIDKKLGCMQGGDFIILAGATGMGKTCMMINLVAAIANLGFKVDVFSLEMSLKQLQNRLICSQTRVDASKFRTRSFAEYEKRVYEKYIKEKLPNLPIKICSEYNITVDRIRDMAKKSDSDIVFIDYLGLINGGSNKSTYDRISDISRELKLTAMEVNKPFFVLHQLNRAYADRQDKTPRLSDLRDSGKIEQDADTVCFVHRPAYYEPNKCSEWDLQFLIAKSRHTGGNTKVDLFYDAKTQTVKEKSL
ncbi:MAG: AAA family ATPase, partial [Candidatus Gastranaerophilales bacterium]|nr:AAA family ATPase [Candidatus Gastranaerophilales bacterium]